MTSDSPNAEMFGWPIYSDSINRGLQDPCCASPDDWHPATRATNALWQCHAAMQKMKFDIEGTSAQLSEVQERRFLVRFVVSLDDFFICVGRLADEILSEKQTLSRLSRNEVTFVRELRLRFRSVVLDNVNSIKKVRNKLGAHTDKHMFPCAVSKLVAALDTHLVGPMLHAALLALQKLSNLNCFAWSSRGYRANEVRLMTCEPYVFSFTKDCPGELRGIEITDSPKRHILESIADLVEKSTWMFRNDQSRLVVTVQNEASQNPDHELGR